MATEGQLAVVGADGSAERCAGVGRRACGRNQRQAPGRDGLALSDSGGPAPVGVAPAAASDEVRVQMTGALSQPVAEGAAA